ncbi:MAG: hypothetical protein AAGJ08_25770 [Cyanobacteria bacterium P01_H01_bin.35]
MRGYNFQGAILIRANFQSKTSLDNGDCLNVVRKQKKLKKFTPLIYFIALCIEVRTFLNPETF